MKAADFLYQLEGVKQTEHGRWVARCPAHKDRNPSLAISETSDRTILIHCFAGCTAQQIVSAVGLSLSDLFPNKTPHHSGRAMKRRDYKGMFLLARRAFYILAIATEDLTGNRPLSEMDLNTVREARDRIIAVMEYFGE